MNQDEKIERFLKTIEDHFSDPNFNTNWPLNGAQIDSYFDLDEALDIYTRIKNLRENKNLEEISKLMPEPDIIRLGLQHNLIIGLKVAKKLGIANINAEKRVEYVNFLLDIINEKVSGDPFCSQGKNFIWNKEKIKSVLEKTKWENVNEQTKKKIAFLTVMTNNLAYTLYFDTYMTGGFYLHGPYNASHKFGENTILVVREYHDLNPKKLWPDISSPYNKIRIMAVYRNLDLKINFVNQPVTRDSIGDKLISYKIYLNDEEIKIKDIDEITENLHKISSNQTKKINSMSDLDKVRKGAQISFYLFKKLRESMGDSWIPKNYIEETINKFGKEFIEKFNYKNKKPLPDLTHWRRIFDPRDDYY